jgi:tetratricopeptide (TPR) repeat protein
VQGSNDEQPRGDASDVLAIDVRPEDEADSASAHVELLLGRLDQTAEPSARARLLVEVALTMQDRLSDRRQAIDALIEAWRADPNCEEILEHLEPLVRIEGCWPEILAETATLAGNDPLRERALAYHEAMVRWFTTDVPNVEQARQWVERIRAVDPTHALVHFLQAALSREHGDYKRELDELDLAVLSTRRKDERLRIHLLLASRYLEERTLNRALAKKHYEQAHRLFPKAMAPLQGLEQIAIAERDTVLLADILKRQADAEIGEREQIAILLRLAKLVEVEFRRPELAAKTLEQVVSRMQRIPGSLHETAEYDGVLDDLERCYRAARMWPELLAVLEQAAITDADEARRGARLKRLGEVLESKLGDIRAALTTYERIAGLMPNDEAVVSELARLAEKASEVKLAVNCRERLAELTKDPVASARHNVVAGQLMMPIDSALARRYFERAVASDATNTVAWNALVWDARTSNDPERLGRYLEARARSSDVPRVQAGFFIELAEHLSRIGDASGERSAYVKAIAADATNESAASALLGPFVEEGRYGEAEALVDVVSAAAERDKDIGRAYSARLAQARIGFAVGKPQLALRAALLAFDAKPEADDARELLVRAASAMRADPDVLRGRDALVRIGESADGLDVALKVGLAEVLALIGENDRAVVLFEDVIAERPEDERALVGLAQHYAAAGNKAASLRFKRQMALGIADLELRLTTLLEVADALAKLDEDQLAGEVYESARVLAPRDLSLLHKLLGCYQRTTRWVNVFDVLRSIAEVDSDPHRRAKTLFTMGQIASGELLDRGAALELFDRTLDVDPSQLEAFERIVRILAEAQDWSGLEAMYRKMIARADAAADKPLRALLGKQLARIQRDRIGDVAGAAATLDAVIRESPADEEARERLTELYASTGQASGAVAVSLERILREPMNPRPYPALFDLLVHEGSLDRAWCVASAMNFLGVRHPAADAMRQQQGARSVDPDSADLGPHGYRLLLHPELDPALSEIFEIVVPAVLDLALSRLSFRARMRHPGPTLRRPEWLALSAARAAKVIGLAPPKLYLRTTPGPAIASAPTKNPGLWIYPSALAPVAPEAAVFMIGRRLMELSPPLFARVLCPSVSELKALASSAARIATERMEGGDLPLKERLKKDDIARLAAIVGTSMDRGGRLDVHRWSELADLSSAYAGLVFAGDLQAARVAVALDPHGPADLPARDKMRELVAWFLGDTSADLRRRLGTALA